MHLLLFSRLNIRKQFWEMLGVAISLVVLLTRGIFPSLRLPFENLYQMMLPVQQSLTETFLAPGNWLQRQQSRIAIITDLEARNAELKTNIAELEFLRQENQELRSLMDSVDELPKIKLKKISIARIVNHSGLSHVIDQGSSAGIASDDIVMSNGALVGRVSVVESEFSQIRLIEDGGIRVQATTLQGVSGVIFARDKKIMLTEIPVDADIQEGEYVYTLGAAGENLPSGLVIGQITSIVQTNAEATKKAIIEPLGKTTAFSVVMIGRKG